MILRKRTNHLSPIIVEKNEQKFYIDNINEGDIVFDIGANIGRLTVLFSKFCGATGCVHSFEPTDSTFNKLSKIVSCLTPANVMTNNVAVSDVNGFIDLNIYEEDYSSWNTMVSRPLEDYGIIIGKPVTQKIPSITIDQYCKEQSIAYIDLLKIDVEGAEFYVLQGAEKMFEERKIKLCVFEFGQTNFEMGVTVKQIEDFFHKHDYEVKNVTKKQEVFPVDKKSGNAIFSVLFAQLR